MDYLLPDDFTTIHKKKLDKIREEKDNIRKEEDRLREEKRQKILKAINQ